MDKPNLRRDLATLTDLFNAAYAEMDSMLVDPARRTEAEALLLGEMYEELPDTAGPTDHLLRLFRLMTLADVAFSAADDMRADPRRFPPGMSPDWFEGMGKLLVGKQLPCFEGIAATAGRQTGARPN